MKTAVLFDLDGTLLDTQEDLLAAVNYALGLWDYPPITPEELLRKVGNGAAQLIRRALPADTAQERVEEVLAAYRPYYTAHCRVRTRPYPGIPEALETLGERYPLAIVSNKPDESVKALCAAYFPGICALGETGACPRKPAPDMLFRAMRTICADTCVYVGDSEVDVLTARAAGVPCVSVLWGFREQAALEAAGAAHLCPDPALLPQAVEEALR